MKKRRNGGFLDFIIDRISDELGDKFQEFQEKGEEFMAKQKESAERGKAKENKTGFSQEEKAEKKKAKKAKKGKKAKAKAKKKKADKKKTIIIEVKEVKEPKDASLAAMKARLNKELKALTEKNAQHRKDLAESHKKEEGLFKENIKNQIANWSK